MQMKITNVKFGEFEFPDKAKMVKKIRDIIANKLTKANILLFTNINFDDMGTIVFDTIPGKHPKKLFLSKTKNKVPLPEGDPRRKKLGREHLETYRLSRSQSDFVWKEAINGTLDKLGVSCDILMQETDSSSVSLRSGMSWGEWKYKEKTNIIQENK